MTLYKLYIGANNTSKKISIKMEDDITQIISTKFESFSFYKIKGYFQGQKEESLIVEIATDNLKKLKGVAMEIRQKYQQDGIGILSCQTGKYTRITKNKRY